MNQQPDTPEDTESLRQEIQAAIAAGRELDPAMDQHLADSVLERYRQERAARQRAALSTTTRNQHVHHPSGGSEIAQIIASHLSATVTSVIGIAAFVAILIWRPDFWWVIFLLPGLLWGWNRRSPHEPNSRARGTTSSQGRQESSVGKSGLDGSAGQRSHEIEII
jgi:hypothetical protein